MFDGIGRQVGQEIPGGLDQRVHTARRAIVGDGRLHRLADYARERGYTTFVALTMGNNTRIIEVLRNSGFPYTAHYATGEVELHLDITQSPAGL